METSQPLHFTTQNAPLAEALARVGFKLVAVWNRYTDGKLDHLKMPTVEAAKKAGKPGDITYVFEREDDLQAALDAWEAAGEALRVGSPLDTNVERSVAIAIVRAVMFGHNRFRDLWKEVPALYIQSNGEAEVKVWEEGEKLHKTITHPGFKVTSI